MLQDFRDRLQGNIAKGIIIAICVPFALVGLESFFRGGASEEVAEVGNVSITQAQLDEAIFLRKRQMIARMGENIDYALLEDAKLRAPALESLIDTQVLVNAATRAGFDITEEQIFDQIIRDPNFQVDGKFSAERFKYMVNQAGLNEEIFVRLTRNEFLIEQLLSGFMSGEFLTPLDVSLYARLSNESRDISVITLPIEKAQKSISVSEQDIAGYYEQNKSSFKTEETVELEYLVIDRKDFLSPVSDKELKGAYEKEVKNFSPENRYSLSHIQIEGTGEKANETVDMILEKIRQGEKFADLAKSYSDDIGTKNRGGRLGKGKAGIFPESFVSAVKSLKPGEVSKPVELDGSLHLVKLDEFIPDKPESFESRKQALKDEIMLAKAEPKFRNAEETLKDLSFNSRDLAEPAKALNVEIQRTPALTKQAVAKLLKNPVLVKAVFSDEVLFDHLNSDVHEIEDGRFASVRVKTYHPSEIKPMDQVKSSIQALLLKDKASELLDSQIESLVDDIGKGNQLPAQIAKSKGYEFRTVSGVKRNSFGQLDREILTSAFELPAISETDKAVYKAVTLINGDKALVLVNNVKAGDVSALSANEKKSVGLILAQSTGNKLFESYQSYQKNHTKITTR